MHPFAYAACKGRCAKDIMLRKEPKLSAELVTALGELDASAALLVHCGASAPIDALLLRPVLDGGTRTLHVTGFDWKLGDGDSPTMTELATKFGSLCSGMGAALAGRWTVVEATWWRCLPARCARALSPARTFCTVTASIWAR